MNANIEQYSALPAILSLTDLNDKWLQVTQIFTQINHYLEIMVAIRPYTR